MRTAIHKNISTPIEFKNSLLAWAQQFREIIFLLMNYIEDNNNIKAECELDSHLKENFNIKITFKAICSYLLVM